MTRYLIYFSYIGTRFRGLQKQFNKGIPLFPNETVQSVLELALSNKNIKPLNTPVIYPASRTDRGVHAICTAAHVDLEYRTDVDRSQFITKCMNSFLAKNEFDLRILSVRKVSDKFSARYSVLRKKYLYRFAVLKPEIFPDLPNNKFVTPIPIIEKDRCYFVINPNFDVDKFQEASKLFIGWNDVRTFMNRATAFPEKDTNKFLESIQLTQGKTLLDCQDSNHFNFWDITFVGRSFVYKQVRRMVAVLLAVSRGQLNIADVKYMLDNPDAKSWNHGVTVVPGYGLYLVNIDYDESLF